MIDNEQIKFKIVTFCNENLPLVTPTTPISRHITDLLLLQNGETITIKASLQAYQYLIDQLIVLGMRVKPVLVIPLIAGSFQITMRIPVTFDDLCQQIDPYETPSLYLIDWQPTKSVASCEEYCAPLPFDLLDDRDHIYVYYREFRYKLGMLQGWEFSRAIYAEYYPNGLLTQ